MTRAPTQAGSRASRTEHYLQCREHSPEWKAVTSASRKQCDSSFGELFRCGLWCGPFGAAVAICVSASVLLVEYLVAIGAPRFDSRLMHL